VAEFPSNDFLNDSLVLSHVIIVTLRRHRPNPRTTTETFMYHRGHSPVSELLAHFTRNTFIINDKGKQDIKNTSRFFAGLVGGRATPAAPDQCRLHRARSRRTCLFAPTGPPLERASSNQCQPPKTSQLPLTCPPFTATFSGNRDSPANQIGPERKLKILRALAIQPRWRSCRL
jgi:hypothetical protein